MNDIKSIVAKNIAELRQSNNMTQLELAEKINYSDKAISKWERAESSPDISVLVDIAAVFGVTVDYLVKADHAEAPVKESEAPKRQYNRKPIAYIAESVAWLVAIVAFIITTLIVKGMTFQSALYGAKKIYRVALQMCRLPLPIIVDIIKGQIS